MLFYVSLGIACVIAAAVVLWVFRSIHEVGTAAYRAILPSAQQKKNSARLAHLNTDLGNAPSPWGWSGTGGARHANLIKDRKPKHHTPHHHHAKSHEKTPWGWPGSNGLHASNMEIISEGIEKSAAVTSVKRMMHHDHPNKPADSAIVDWPYRNKGQQKTTTPQRSRYVGTSRNTGKDKPWGW